MAFGTRQARRFWAHRLELRGAEPPSFTAEAGGDLRPSQRGAVSVRRGGGAFEFTITPKTNPGLDKEELVCIGRVLDEDLPVLDALNAIPAKKIWCPSLGDVPPLGSKIARACEYANPDATCAQFKPRENASWYLVWPWRKLI